MIFVRCCRQCACGFFCLRRDSNLEYKSHF